MKTRLLCAVMLLALAIGLAMPAAAQWDPPQGTTDKAQAVYLYQLDTETLVYAKNENERRAPASLTKLMTALLLVESGQPLDTPFTIPDGLQPEFNEILANYGTRAGLLCGETVTLQDLLYGCLLPSGNDAASAIAWYLGDGDEAAFLDQMNRRAAELGCTDTHFSCPHGLDSMDQGNYSTAQDMFRIARACMENEMLMEVMCSTEYWMPLTELHTQADAGAPEGKSYRIRSTVVMQNPDSPLYRDYIRGMKTGFTDEAGRCFVSGAQQGGANWLLVVMGAQDGLAEDGVNYAFHTTADLYDWALEALAPTAAVNTETPATQLPLRWCAEADTVGLYARNPLVVLAETGSSTLETRIETTVDSLTAPVQAGTVLGRLTVQVNGETVGSTELVALRDYERSFWLYANDLVRPWLPLLAAVGIALLIGLVLLARLLAHKAAVRRRRKALRVTPPRNRENP